MSLIEGVGDEVVHFVGVVFVFMVAAVAWWSTNARPGRYRTVLVMRARTRHPVTVRIGRRANLMMSSTQTSSSTQGPITETTGINTATRDPTGENNANVIPLQEMDSIVDADMAMMDNNRLHYYRRLDSPNNNPQPIAEPASDVNQVQEEAEPVSNAQMREMDSIVSAMEADVTTGCDIFTRPNESNTSASKPAEKKDENKENLPSSANAEKPPENGSTDSVDGATDMPAAEVPNTDSAERDRRKILIKLKYLNDTLKEVEGSLDELLKDFKWRHFSTELTAECRVRLIFNGRVLIDDAATLRACGLHDRAVVHCLVHPKRNNNPQQNGQLEETVVSTTHQVLTERAPAERAWDLENILMTLVSVALTVVWFFRCEYSNMFTASASVALLGLTVFYSVAIFALYLSDSLQLERRPPAVPQH